MVFIPRASSANSVIPRKEVRDFFSDQKQSSLFLQAFAIIQARDSNDPKSFAQVASIHGLPNTVYDNFPSEKQDGGYCVHGAVLFPTWHRPYIALIETIIIEAAIDLAKKYTVDTQLWLAAAQKIRFPYWDWANTASQQDGVPDILCAETVTINAAPSGQAQMIRNPLASFDIPLHMRQAFPNELGPLKTFERTVRFPINQRDVKTKSDLGKLKVAMKSLSPQLRSMVRVLFDGTVTKWADFSNHSMDNNHTQPGNYHSLEYVHDQVHGTISGGAGHMGYPEVAAYDPIFYFHHCNIDRLLALYEATFNVYIDGALAGKPLAPFRDSAEAAAAWTSTEVHDTNVMSYTYTELKEKGRPLQQTLLSFYGAPAIVTGQKQQPLQPDPVAQKPIQTNLAVQKPLQQQSNDFVGDIQKGFSNLLSSTFGGSANHAVNQGTTSRGLELNTSNGPSRYVPPAAEPPASEPHATVSAQQTSSAYAHFRIQKNCLNGPFTVRFLVNNHPAGESFVFARRKKDTCSNCLDLDDLLLGGACSLTESFRAAGILERPEAWQSAVKVQIFDWEGHTVGLERVPTFQLILRGAVVKTVGCGVQGVNGVEKRRNWSDELLVHFDHRA
ncbi:hypothetical protein BC830DRAFT_1169129 [Chytriomyces sp. MP71]|nr:hypothetical protein BC830DRAFT_1169129 [Chytriomyces sp. MP71]